jgi:hypothetical protein
MSSANLENLVKANQLKSEPPDQHQVEGMIRSARNRLADLKVDGISDEGKFLLAYVAAHSLALAALRWHGYRSDKRYIVFQCLEQTTGLEAHKWRLLAQCHNLRNGAEYEGTLEITPQLLQELIAITLEVLRRVEGLGPTT